MLDSITLRYGLNPNQKPATAHAEGQAMPLKVKNGQPGYINLLDALNGWQLVRELKVATGLASAASFKHVSPAGVGTATPLSDVLLAAYHLDSAPSSAIALAYARARGADRMSSFGDFIALSDTCDEETATLVKREVSDGIIAPGYTDEALAILSSKKKGAYLVLEIDEGYAPESADVRTVFGITLEQPMNDTRIDASLLACIPTQNASIPESAIRDLLIALVTLKYTQSNSVCFAYQGQTIGIGAGQQSRVQCVRLAGDKADKWHLRQHPAILALPFKEEVRLVDRDNAIDCLLGNEADAIIGTDRWKGLFTEMPSLPNETEKAQWLGSLEGVSLGSDAFFPFGDSIERAAKSGVGYVAQTGGSINDEQVIATCDAKGIAMAMTGVRLFHH